MHIHSNNKVTRIYNVIGTLRGAVEPGKLIIWPADIDRAVLLGQGLSSELWDHEMNRAQQFFDLRELT